MPVETPIKPYAGGEPGSKAPSTPQRIPYDGGVIEVSPEARRAAAAAQEFAQAHPLYEAVIKRGVNNLDSDSQLRLNELRQRMRDDPAKPATIINLHPWPLTFGSNVFLRGITVPACHPGMPLAHYHVRGYRVEHQYKEDGTLEFKEIRPIRLAAEFVREFSNKDTYGGGVIIYQGEGHPDKVAEVETYDPLGRPVTIPKQILEYDEEGRPVQVMSNTPVRRKLSDLIAEEHASRNKRYFERVQRADHDYKLPDGRGKWLITDVHRMMAEVLFAEGVIPVVPEWNLASRLEQGLAENSCGCGTPVKADAAWCPVCSHILKPVLAYRMNKISDGHAALEFLTSDEMDEIEEIKQMREDAKAAREKGNKKTK